jgi:hypothetical protein
MEEEAQRAVQLLKETLIMNDGTLTKEPQVRRQVNKMSTNLDELNKAIDRLEERLTSVTASTPPNPQSDEAEQDALVPLASEIDNFNRLIEIARTRVVDIIGRLEI